MAEEKSPVAHALNSAGVCLLFVANANSLSETQECVNRCKTLSLISDAQQVMCSIHLDAADSLLKK